jgi:hypothetical protein
MDVTIRALLLLKRKNGKILPGDVIKAATPRTSVLHSEFTWDNSVAGHQWRLQEARMLIARCKVEMQTPDGLVNVRYFVALKADEEGYRVTQDVVRDPLRAHALLAELAQELTRLRERYRVFETLINQPELFEQLDALIQRARPEARP